MKKIQILCFSLLFCLCISGCDAKKPIPLTTAEVCSEMLTAFLKESGIDFGQGVESFTVKDGYAIQKYATSDYSLLLILDDASQEPIMMQISDPSKNIVAMQTVFSHMLSYAKVEHESAHMPDDPKAGKESVNQLYDFASTETVMKNKY